MLKLGSLESCGESEHGLKWLLECHIIYLDCSLCFLQPLNWKTVLKYSISNAMGLLFKGFHPSHKNFNYPADLDELKWIPLLQIMPCGLLASLFFVHVKLPLLIIKSTKASPWSIWEYFPSAALWKLYYVGAIFVKYFVRLCLMKNHQTIFLNQKDQWQTCPEQKAHHSIWWTPIVGCTLEMYFQN